MRLLTRANPFHVVLKPNGPSCNLACGYCFYLRTTTLYPAGADFRMSDAVLETFTRQYLDAHPGPEVTFAWQGGEPTLLGLDFFRRATALQARHRRPGTRIANVLQTNGILLDAAWCGFLRDHDFLVGLSLDGPRALHDAHRVDRGGHPTFDRVCHALDLLRTHRVRHNVLCVVSRANAAHPLEVYRFFTGEGVQWLQVIPAVEQAAGSVSDRMLPAAAWGHFLCAVFDEWVRHDVGRVFVQQFDVALEAAAGLEPTLCVHARTCGRCLAMEHDGAVFACDHFVRPDHHRGNILDAPLAALVEAEAQRRFGADKWDTLPPSCRRCPVLRACHGGCPKDRLAHGSNVLCEGYRAFFEYVEPYVTVMATLLRARRPSPLIMEMLAGRVPARGPCPCGSGRRHKRCCGERLASRGPAPRL